MSNSPELSLESPDVLSTVLSWLELKAEIYANGDYCGAWALDTSGDRHIPFHLIGQGRAWLHLKDKPSQMLSTGDLVIFPHDAQHIVSDSMTPPPSAQVNTAPNSAEGDSTNVICGFFKFQNKAVWPLLDSLPEVILLDLAQQTHSSHIRQLINMIINELQDQQQGVYTVINQLAYLLFIQVIRQQIQTSHLQTGLLAAMFDPKIAKALACIHNHSQKNWTLASLAQSAAMGRSSFASRFNELVGMPAMQYLGYWRMQQAKHLLRTTHQSMLEIAETCGYQSEAAFRKAFKKITGETPGSIRKKLASQPNENSNENN